MILTTDQREPAFERRALTIYRLRDGKRCTALLAFALLLLVSVSRASVQVANIWTGGTGNWNVSGNWTNGVPNNGNGNYYDVFILAGGSDTVTFNALPTAIDTLSVGAGQTLQAGLDGNSYYLNIGDPNSSFANSGTLVNNGQINWENGGILTIGNVGGPNIHNANITNTGTINIGNATLQVNGDFGSNTGILTIGNSSEGTITGILTNAAGVVNVTGASELNAATLNTSGALTVDSTSFLNVGSYIMSGGTTFIGGTLNGPGSPYPNPTFTQTGGTLTIAPGATASASTWKLSGGTQTIQGAMLTTAMQTIGGALNVQNGGTLVTTLSMTVSGSLITGNAVLDTGNNLVNVTGNLNLTGTGSINLNANGDLLTAGGLTSSGSLTLNAGSSLLVNGNLNNSGSLNINGGCPLTGCANSFAPVTIIGGLTNSGNINVPPFLDEVLRTGVTLQTLENDYNTGNIGMAIVDGFLLFGPTEVPELFVPFGGTTSLPQVDFNNQSGGTFSMTGASETVQVDGSWKNNAGSTLTISGGSGILITGASVVNGGTIILSGGADSIITPAFSNNGTVTIGARETISVQVVNTTSPSGYTQTGGTTDVNGTLISPVVSVSGGVLEGSGAIGSSSANAAVTISSGGTIQAGDPPAILSITGTLALSGGTENELLGGSVWGSGYGALDVSGSTSLSNALLTLEEVNGFKPSNGEIFNILNSNGLTGQFMDNTIGFQGGKFYVSYLTSGCAAGYSNCVDLTWQATPTPEPASLPLLLAGLAGLALAQCRRRWS